MAVSGAESALQLGEVLCAEEVVHPFPHLVAERCPLGQSLPCGREVLVPEGFHCVVDVIRNILGKFLHPPAAVEGDAQQHRHDA